MWQHPASISPQVLPIPAASFLQAAKAQQNFNHLRLLCVSAVPKGAKGCQRVPRTGHTWWLQCSLLSSLTDTSTGTDNGPTCVLLTWIHGGAYCHVVLCPPWGPAGVGESRRATSLMTAPAWSSTSAALQQQQHPQPAQLPVAAAAAAKLWPPGWTRLPRSAASAMAAAVEGPLQRTKATQQLGRPALADLQAA